MVGMHPLEAFLEKHNLSQNQFAKDAGVSQPTISRYINGETKQASAKNALKIEKATNGTVTRMELLFPNEYP